MVTPFFFNWLKKEEIFRFFTIGCRELGMYKEFFIRMMSWLKGQRQGVREEDKIVEIVYQNPMFAWLFGCHEGSFFGCYYQPSQEYFGMLLIC